MWSMMSQPGCAHNAPTMTLMTAGSLAVLTNATSADPRRRASERTTEERWKAVIVGDERGVEESVVRRGSRSDAGYERRCSKCAKNGG